MAQLIGQKIIQSSSDVTEQDGKIVDSITIVTLGIHSLPGNKFYLTEASKNKEYSITIGNTGNLSIDLSDSENSYLGPIYADANNNYTTYPTIIDYVYSGNKQEGGNINEQ